MTPDPLKEITTELFTVIRDVYNNGSIDTKYDILDNCMDIILESLVNESDKEDLKRIFDRISGS
jgi:hypothetical protein